jgi:hypothetical protein
MKITCLLLFLTTMISALYCQSTVTIGSGTASQPYPFNFFGGYARSASIYTSGEIGSAGVITSLGWEVVTADIESCPVKIYLELITDGTLYSIAWSDLISQATLVYDASASFPSPGWNTIDIADFVYMNNDGQNLLVLCEANYGGNGASSNPVFAFSLNPDQHETWQQYETPPTEPGAPDEYRPNIQISYFPLSNPHPPSGFIALPGSTSQVDLQWTRNSSQNNVMVAFNTANVFGTPSGTYVAGNTIAGGGTVLYNGSDTVFTHDNGLSPATTYYYSAWSVIPSIPAYSVATASSATTLCIALNNFPDTIDFESAAFPPVCWSLAQKPWMHNGSVSANGIGTGSAFADFFDIPAGNSFDLVSPLLDLSALTNPVISFDHAYATYSGEMDVLEFWVSNDYGESYSLKYTWQGGLSGPLNTGGAVTVPYIPSASEWASKSYDIPAGTNRILLRGVGAWGNNLYLDNITIGDPVIVWNGSVSGLWNDPLNWSPGVIPPGSRHVTIPSGTPNDPVVSGLADACNDLLIQPGASVTVLPGSVLTIMGNLTIRNGATLTNDGSVILKGNLVNQNTE